MVTMCQVGAGLVTASILVSVLSTQGKKQFVASLDAAQAEAYKRVARERLMIYLAALAIGGVAGWSVVSNVGSESGWSAVCAGTGVATVVAYFVYRLWPKELWMLNYLTSPQQTQLWLQMYRSMSLNFHVGFLVGICGFAVFFRGVCGRTSSKESG